MATKRKTETEYKGLKCVGYVVFGDMEGHRILETYVEDLEVEVNGYDIYDMLTDAAKDDITSALIDEARNQ